MYGTALWAILTIRSRIPRAAGSGAVLARIGEGLVLVRGDRRLIGALVVTVIYNLFAWPFTSMIPVIGRDLALVEGYLMIKRDGIAARRAERPLRGQKPTLASTACGKPNLAGNTGNAQQCGRREIFLQRGSHPGHDQAGRSIETSRAERDLDRQEQAVYQG
jgi:hypothetical protein